MVRGVANESTEIKDIRIRWIGGLTSIHRLVTG